MANASAVALRLSYVDVFRKAGPLPEGPDDDDPTLREALARFDQLPSENQERVLLFIRSLEDAQHQESASRRPESQSCRAAQAEPRAAET